MPFAPAHVERTHDSYNWTPLECLEELVRAIKAGEESPTKIAIHYWYDVGDRRKHGCYCAQVTTEEHIALMTVAIHQDIDRWRS
jgi:hypothetical protein